VKCFPLPVAPKTARQGLVDRFHFACIHRPKVLSPRSRGPPLRRCLWRFSFFYQGVPNTRNFCPNFLGCSVLPSFIRLCLRIRTFALSRTTTSLLFLPLVCNNPPRFSTHLQLPTHILCRIPNLYLNCRAHLLFVVYHCVFLLVFNFPYPLAFIYWPALSLPLFIGN